MQLRRGAPLAESGAVGRRKAFGVLATLLLSGILATLALAQGPVTEGRRVALLIGNGKYRHTGALNNPANDVRAMARALKSVGFDVLAHEDLELRPMLRALADFAERMQRGGVGLFYYSGHAVQVSGLNHLVPIDAELPTDKYVASDTVDLRHALNRMDGAENQLNIVILDACRNNPFARKWPSMARSGPPSRGLAPTTAPPGTFVAYATEPDSVASDGSRSFNVGFRCVRGL